MTEIAAGDLTLRPLRETDADDIVAACADPEIPRYIPAIPFPYGEDDARAWLAQQDELRERQGEFNFAIVRDGRFLGVVAVRAYEGGTVGYWLAPWVRGQGVMTRAVRAVVAWAQREQGIRTLTLLAHTDNVASRRVAERAGFRLVGPATHEPAFRDGTSSAVRYEFG